MTFRLKLILGLLVGIMVAGCTPIWERHNKAGLQVITNDVTTSIYLDDQYLDKTPYINKELKPGTYTLKIQPDDPQYVPYETSVTLRKGLLTVITWKPGNRPELSGGVIYELEKLDSNQQTEVALTSIPDGAIISIDNGTKEFTPFVTSTITPGTHEISVSLPSYETQEHTINVVEGHRLNISIKLAKNPTEPIQVNSNDLEASVSAQTQTASPTPSPVASAGPTTNKTTTSSASASTAKQVTIKPTNFYVEGKEVLRVRDKAGLAGKEVGFVAVGKNYATTGNTESGWYEIKFEGKTGWVSGDYVTLQ